MSHNKQTLEGRVALITGGARGIGKAIAENFVQSGARVVIVDNGGDIDGRNPNPDIVKDAANQLGESAVGGFVDIGSAESAANAVALAKEKWGRLDIVVNNAAILRYHFIFKARPEDFDEVIRVNLAGYYHVLSAAAPIFREQAKAGTPEAPYTWGRVINIVSTAGFYGNYGQSAYASAKNGVIGLTRVAALDLARSKVLVNAIEPFARSRVTEIIVPANEEQATYKERALRIEPKHVSSVVNWLCSDKGKEITGQLFGVRGREVFLFAQPRPVRKFVMEPEVKSGSLAEQAKERFEDAYTELVTDLESFNSEPVL